MIQGQPDLYCCGEDFAGQLVHDGLDRDYLGDPAGVSPYGEKRFFLVGVIAGRTEETITYAETAFIAFFGRTTRKFALIILQEDIAFIAFRLAQPFDR